MSAEDRRDAVLDAATRAFARGGFAGSSTDAVAKEAGVSQPYVVRLFGTKRDLFLAVFGRTCDRVRSTFADVIADGPFDPEKEEDRERLGLSYTVLLRDRDLLRVMMHGFSTDDPEISRVAREWMAAIFALLTSTGWSDEGVREFIAQGMLLNVLLSIGALEHPGDSGPLLDLVRSCLPEEALALVASPAER
jgi:AcrR family transcriptional regulator